EEAIQDIQEGIQLFIESYRKRGKPLPPELNTLTCAAMGPGFREGNRE
ncbi:MAG: hypothetical protein HYX93_04050, partial [Chloroflexi bacterium]|nr:hypothetical protein [Chloroflexota bacterium]